MYPVHAPLPPDSSYETWLNSSLSAKSPICEPFFDWLEGWQLYVKQLQETFPVYVPLHIQQDPFAGVVDLSKPFDWEALSGPQMIMLDDSILLGRKEETIPSYRSRGDSEEEDLRLIDKLRTQRHELSEARTRTKQRDLRIPSNATMQPGKRNRLFVANDSDSDSGSSTKTYVTAPTGRSPTRSPESEVVILADSADWNAAKNTQALGTRKRQKIVEGPQERSDRIHTIEVVDKVKKAGV